MIVWDRGTWELHGSGRRRAAVERRRDPRRAATARSCAAGSCSCARARRATARSSGSLLHKRDDARGRRAGTPRTTPSRCSAAGRTTRSRRTPTRLWTRERARPRLDGRASRSSPPRPTTSSRALDALGREGRVDVPGPRARAHEPRQGAVPGARRRGIRSPSATSSATTPSIAPTLLPYLARPAAQPPPLPRRRRTRRASGRSRRRRTRPSGSRAGDNDDADTGESEQYLVADTRRDARVAREPRRGRAAPVDVAGRGRAPSRRTRSSTSTRATDDHVGRAAHARAPAPHRARAPRRARLPEGHRAGAGIQIWIPIEPGPTFAETRAWVEQLSRAVGARRARARELASGRSGAAAGRARLDYTQNAINKTLVAPYSARAAAGRAGVDADRLGRARRSRAALPTGGRSARSSTRRRGGRPVRRPGAHAPGAARPRTRSHLTRSFPDRSPLTDLSQARRVSGRRSRTRGAARPCRRH